MAYSRSDFDLAQRHVAEADARIGRQRALLARMRSTGQPLALGEDLLQSLETVAAQMRRHRDAIAGELAAKP